MNVQELLKNNMVVDAHNDILCDVVTRRRGGQKKVLETFYLDDFKAGNVNCIIAAVFIDSLFVPQMALEMALEQISSLKYEIEESPQYFALCTSYNEITKAVEEGKVAFLLSMEGAAPIGTNFTLLRIFYDLGIRFFGPAWARRNFVVDGSIMTNEEQGVQGSFTPFGREIIVEAQRLGITLDISHITDVAYDEFKNIVNKPFIASHSNIRELYNLERNLTDSQVKDIAELGGVIGVNGVSVVLADCDENCTIDKMINNIDYIKDLVGMDYVGLGLDMFENITLMGPIYPPDKQPRRIFDVIKGYENLPKLIERMAERGYTEQEIIQFTGGNFMRLFKQVL